MTMELKKDPNRRRKGPKPIKETKASKPENRVSTETISQLNTLKMVLGLYSQDDVVAKGLDYLVGNLNGPDRRYYNILLEVEKRRNNK